MNDRHLVLIVPGIRDRGGDWNVVKKELEQAGLEAAVVSWGEFFGIPRFLVPAPWFRRTAMRRLERCIQDAILVCTDKVSRQVPEVSFIAHSFGSYILCYLLRRNYHIRTSRLILCGSVLPRSFPFTEFHERFRFVINDVGNKDNWPFVASCVTFGYGTIGTYGHYNLPVKDRFHTCVDHSGFTKPGFASRWWVPVLKADKDWSNLYPDPNVPRREGTLLRSLRAFAQNIKWLVVLALIVYLVHLLLPWLPCEAQRALRITEVPCDARVNFDRVFDLRGTQCTKGEKPRHYEFNYKDELTFTRPVPYYFIAAESAVANSDDFKNDSGKLEEKTESPFLSEGGLSLFRTSFRVRVDGTSLNYRLTLRGNSPSIDNTWGIGIVSSLPINSVKVRVILPEGVRISGLKQDEASKRHFAALERVGCVFSYEGKAEPSLICPNPLQNTPNVSNYLNWTWNAFEGC